ncbi:MAG: hypothetical protein QXK37_03775 [Candidatus Woesearchaeota archaeon]
MEQLTSNPYIVPECAYAVDANTLFNGAKGYKNYLNLLKFFLKVWKYLLLILKASIKQ